MNSPPGATAQDVAEKFALHRPGHRLCDFTDVGLPLYRLTIRATVLAHKKLSPIEEFVLKALHTGVESAQSLARFLGLEEVVVRSVLAELMRSESVCLLAPQGSREQVLALTEKGKLAMFEAERITPEEVSLAFEFDGLLRTPLEKAPVPAVAPRELRDLGHMEIPPFPSKRPEIEDLDIPEVQRVIDELARGDKKTILSLDRIERRQRFHVPAVALVYRAEDGSGVQVGFFVDGREMPSHDLAFAEAKGVERLGIDSQIFARSGPDPMTFPSEVTESAKGAYDQVRKIHAELTPLAAELREATTAAGPTKDEDEAVVVLRERVSQLENQLSHFEIRHIEVHEHGKLFKRAMNECKSRFLVVSPWVRNGVVDRVFLADFEGMLKRGVEAYLAYGMGDRDKPDIDNKADRALVDLRRRYPNFRMKKLGNTHAKVLVCDSQFVVTGSFNWLSFRGDPDRTFRDEASFLISVPNEIDSIYRFYVDQF